MSKEQLVEYWAKGTVNGKKFQITTPDAYDHKQIHKQNPHLSADEAKAVADHTYTDDFEGGRESSRSTQGGHKVHVHSHGGYSDENDTEAQELFKNVRKESIESMVSAVLEGDGETAQHDPVAYRSSAMQAIRNKSSEAGNKASYMLGSNADRLGLSHKHNPYKPGTSSHRHWANGLEDSTKGVHRPPIGEEVDLNLEDFDQLDELSKETLGKYIKKATSDAESGVAAHAYDAGREDESGNYKRGDKANARAAKRVGGIEKAVDRLTKESVEAMVSAVLDGDQESASAAFGLAMGEKLTDRMDAMKIEIASTLAK